VHAFASTRPVRLTRTRIVDVQKEEEMSGLRLLSVTVGITAVVGMNNIAWGQTSTAPAAGADWRTPAGTVQGTRFSALDQINTTNVNQLQEDFTFEPETPIPAGFEGQPLVVNGIMYVVTPFPDFLYALDATDGDEIFRFDPHTDPFAQDKACCDIVNRGAAFHPADPAVPGSVDKVIYNLLDTTTVAVNARTGKEIWRHRNGNDRIGESMTMAPLVIKNRVFVGNSGAELGVRGFIAALDAETGNEVWRAWSTGPDSDVKIVPGVTHPPYAKDAAPEQGVTSWLPPGDFTKGGSTVWGWVTYDPDTNLLFHGTANPGVWDPEQRPGENKWSTTMFARDPETGIAQYMYQMTPHDSWDYDGVNEDIVAEVGGRKIVQRFDRNGFAYTHDRLTGRILVANPYVPVNWAAAIDIAGTGLPIIDPAKQPHLNVPALDVCPAYMGGKDEQPAAFSPRTELFYVPTNAFCMDYEGLVAVYIAGAPFMGVGVQVHPFGFPAPQRVEQRGFGPPVQFPFPCAEPGVNCGAFIAWDANTGTRRFTITEKFPVWSGVLATAGDVVFYGTLDRFFKAVDARTGAVLFQTKLPAGIVGNPMTYLGRDGQQRVAIWSGPGGTAAALVPHHFSLDDPSAEKGAMRKLPEFTPPGNTLHVFKLGGRD
jgi:lanthanide-dependent methanol dehydrogenase